MSLTLGEKLRQAREARDITISEVAEQTRISPLYIQAIENNDYRTLPGGIFNKGFVKSFAKYVGIEEQEALQDYSRVIAEQEVSQGNEPKIYRPEVLTDDRTSSSKLPTIIFAVIILGLMTWGILAFLNYIKENPEQTQNTNSNSLLNSAENINRISETPTPATAPSMNDLKVEFRALNSPISLSSVSDGKRVVISVTPDKPAIFEPKDNLKLGFAKSLAQNAQLTINGKQIKLPSAPENPNRIAIEFEINKDNIGRIWQNGEITFGN
ncbi:MAG: helix-turn-helix domain-containing protein [Acidobacteria bacterium]|nr:helix-turn-helix domain-containing protein [Acidobacteriota bacterium]